jgi:hypothetical protein
VRRRRPQNELPADALATYAILTPAEIDALRTTRGMVKKYQDVAMKVASIH